MHRYRIILSRDRPDLLGTLAVLYGQKGKVESCSTGGTASRGPAAATDRTAAVTLSGSRSCASTASW